MREPCEGNVCERACCQKDMPEVDANCSCTAPTRNERVEVRTLFAPSKHWQILIAFVLAMHK